MDLSSDYTIVEDDTDTEIEIKLSSIENNDQRKIKEKYAIKYLCLLKEPFKILNSQKALNSLKYIQYISSDLTGFDCLENYLQQSFIEIVIDFIKRQYDNIKDFLKKIDLIDQHQKVKSQRLCFLELCYEYFMCFLKILLNMTSKSNIFCIKFQENRGVKILFYILNCQSLISKYIEKSINQKNETFQSIGKLIECILGSILNISYFADKLKKGIYISTRLFTK